MTKWSTILTGAPRNTKSIYHYRFLGGSIEYRGPFQTSKQSSLWSALNQLPKCDAVCAYLDDSDFTERTVADCSVAYSLGLPIALFIAPEANDSWARKIIEPVANQTVLGRPSLKALADFVFSSNKGGRDSTKVEQAPGSCTPRHFWSVLTNAHTTLPRIYCHFVEDISACS